MLTIEVAAATESDNSPENQFSLMNDLAHGNVMKRQIVAWHCIAVTASWQFLFTNQKPVPT